MFTKYFVVNKQGKFGVTIFMHYTDVVIFVLGHFILTHPVDITISNRCKAVMQPCGCNAIESDHVTLTSLHSLVNVITFDLLNKLQCR